MSAAKKIAFLLFSSLLISIAAAAQPAPSFEYATTIAGDFSYFTIDHLDNIYLLTNAGQLKKRSPNGDTVVFNEVRTWGKLFSVDATNPLKILLYYKNFATIAVLDRFLNVRNTIALRKQNIFSVTAIATSYDNHIWLFDEGNAALKKIDDNGDVLQATPDLRNLLDTVPSLSNLVDRDGLVYGYDSAHGFYSFDYYGAFKNRLPFLNWKSTSVNGHTLFGFADASLYQYVQGSLQLKQYALPPAISTALQIKVGNNKVYALQPNGVEVYLLKP